MVSAGLFFLNHFFLMMEWPTKYLHWLSAAILMAINLWSTPVSATLLLGQQVLGILLLLGSVVCQWFGLVWIVHQSRRYFPELTQFRSRLFFSLFWGLLWVATWMALSEWLGTILLQAIPYQPTWETLVSYLLNGAVFTLTGIGITEWIDYYGQLQQSEKEKEELFRLNLMAQYDSLKQQVNPHFLFNSLNSLSSLISIDPARAEIFVEEMSHVYRYLLQSNREELTPLYRELSFIRSYLHLLQTRFGEALRVNLDIPESAQQALIPPLTLQVLVENAVKHNEVSSQNPLYLRIGIDPAGQLQVVNNLQKKQVAVPSEKVGLANIIAKYRLLGQAEVCIVESATEFSVTLPLQKKGTL